MPSYFITGTSRGIGLAIVTELLKDPQNFVIASARNPGGSKGLSELASQYHSDRLTLVTLDTSVPGQITAAAAEAQKLLPSGLDYLINNAGVSYQNSATSTFDELDIELFEKELLFNTVPIIHILRAFKPLVLKSAEKKVLFVTSELGSIEIADARPNLANAYGVGKAALNMLARKWGAVTKDEGIISILIHPGWVDTELGNNIDAWIQERVPGLKPISTQESAKGVIKVIQEAKKQDAVPFVNYDGSVIPW
ncbi:unnamed protein product [Somion occarium]|uniref:Uncharacterized protein n=1 Tax=Somion occarium TaxID=3059160 RepID=A0ABP1CTW4_9APHY